MSNAWHCDRDGCDTWSRSGFKHGFIQVYDGTEPVLHFCCWDCILKYAARFAPLEVIDNG